MYILFCVDFVSSIILFYIILELCNFLHNYHRPQHQSHLLVITVLAGGNKYLPALIWCYTKEERLSGRPLSSVVLDLPPSLSLQVLLDPKITLRFCKASRDNHNFNICYISTNGLNDLLTWTNMKKIFNFILLLLFFLLSDVPADSVTDGENWWKFSSCFRGSTIQRVQTELPIILETQQNIWLCIYSK